MATAEGVNKMQGYNRHIVSDFLTDRYPYMEDITGHLKTDEVTMAYGDRLFPRLVEQLKAPMMAPEKLCEALRTICDLCAHQENKCTAIDWDLVAAATNLLTHESIPVRRDAARAITSAAQVIGGRSKMPQGNTKMGSKKVHGLPGPTLQRLVKLLLGCDDEEVKMNVAEALGAVTVHRDGCQQVVDQGASKSVVQYLIATLPDVPATRALSMCLLFCLRTLAAVAIYAKFGLQDIVGVALLEKVIAFLGRVPPEGIPSEKSTETLRCSIRLLWHAGNDSAARKEMLGADGVRVVSLYLTHSDAGVREAAVCALSVLSLETWGKQEVLKHSKEALAQMLYSSEETVFVHKTCVQLTRAASELPAFRNAFARHTLRNIWLLEEVYGTTALAAVGPLLRAEEDVETRTQALHVMSHFMRQGSPAEGDTIRVPALCPLRKMHTPALFAFEECADIFHDLLALLPLAETPALQCLEALTDFARPREALKAILADGLASVDEARRHLIDKLLQKTSDALSSANTAA